MHLKVYNDWPSCSNGDLLNIVEIANEFMWSLNIGSEGLEDFNDLWPKSYMNTTFLQAPGVGIVHGFVLFLIYLLMKRDCIVNSYQNSFNKLINIEILKLADPL